jgi:hypothetical protein
MHFGVCDDCFICLSGIAASSNYLLVERYHRTNRHFMVFSGRSSLNEGLVHEVINEIGGQLHQNSVPPISRGVKFSTLRLPEGLCADPHRPIDTATP